MSHTRSQDYQSLLSDALESKLDTGNIVIPSLPKVPTLDEITNTIYLYWLKGSKKAFKSAIDLTKKHASTYPILLNLLGALQHLDSPVKALEALSQAIDRNSIDKDAALEFLLLLNSLNYSGSPISVKKYIHKITVLLNANPGAYDLQYLGLKLLFTCLEPNERQGIDALVTALPIDDFEPANKFRFMNLFTTHQYNRPSAPQPHFSFDQPFKFDAISFADGIKPALTPARPTALSTPSHKPAPEASSPLDPRSALIKRDLFTPPGQPLSASIQKQIKEFITTATAARSFNTPENNTNYENLFFDSLVEKLSAADANLWLKHFLELGVVAVFWPHLAEKLKDEQYVAFFINQINETIELHRRDLSWRLLSLFAVANLTDNAHLTAAMQQAVNISGDHSQDPFVLTQYFIHCSGRYTFAKQKALTVSKKETETKSEEKTGSVRPARLITPDNENYDSVYCEFLQAQNIDSLLSTLHSALGAILDEEKATPDAIAKIKIGFDELTAILERAKTDKNSLDFHYLSQTFNFYLNAIGHLHLHYDKLPPQTKPFAKAVFSSFLPHLAFIGQKLKKAQSLLSLSQKAIDALNNLLVIRFKNEFINDQAYRDSYCSIIQKLDEPSLKTDAIGKMLNIFYQFSSEQTLKPADYTALSRTLNQFHTMVREINPELASDINEAISLFSQFSGSTQKITKTTTQPKTKTVSIAGDLKLITPTPLAAPTFTPTQINTLFSKEKNRKKTGDNTLKGDNKGFKKH